MRGPAGMGVLVALCLAACGRGDRSKDKGELTVRVNDTRSTEPEDPAARAWAILDAVDWTGEPPIDWSLAVGNAADWHVPEGYAGSDACTECHPDEAARYAGHAMARTGLRRIDPRADRDIVAAFSAGTTVVHERSGFSYRPFIRNRRLYIEESIDDAGGARVHSQVVEVTHTYAAGAIGRAFGYARGDYVYQVPLDWYPGANRWALDPSFGVGNPRFSRAFSSFCLACHTEYPARSATSADVVRQPLPPGVGCERCHGPGARHSATGRTDEIVNPARLPAARQLDVCAQCHLQGTAEVLRAHRTAFDYRAGERLFDHRANYVEATPSEDDFQLTAQADRLARSACFRGAGGKLTCTTCHDPHDSAASDWRKACLSCHQETSCKGPAAAREANGDACVDCHMRRDTPHDFRMSVPGVSLPIVDHWIRRTIAPPSDVTQRARPRPAGEIRPWPALLGEASAGGDAVEAIALRNSGHAAQALPLMVAALAKRPADREVYTFFSDQYAAFAGTFSDAATRERALTKRRAALAAAVRAVPDDTRTLLDYARASVGAGDVTEATRALDRALRLEPNQPEALTERALIHVRAGRAAEAAPLLARAIEVGAAPADARIMAAVAARASGDRRGAIAHLEAARILAPGDLWIIDELIALYGDGKESQALTRVRRYFADRGATPAASRAHRLLATDARTE